MRTITQISLLFFCYLSITAFAVADEPIPAITLVDFEDYIPCSQCGDNLGYRKNDIDFAERVPDGAGGSDYSALFTFNAQ